MAEEDIKKPGEGEPAPASGEEEPKDQPPKEEPPKEEPPKETGDTDQLNTELKKKDDKIAELSGTIEKQKTQLEQAGYNIQQLKEKMKEAGIEVDEEKGMTLEQIMELLNKNNELLTQKFGQQFQELLKSIANKPQTATTGGGGQKKSQPKYPVPDSEEVRRLLNKGWKWNTETGKIKSPDKIIRGRKIPGVEYDLNAMPDVK